MRWSRHYLVRFRFASLKVTCFGLLYRSRVPPNRGTATPPTVISPPLQDGQTGFLQKRDHSLPEARPSHYPAHSPACSEYSYLDIAQESFALCAYHLHWGVAVFRRSHCSIFDTQRCRKATSAALKTHLLGKKKVSNANDQEAHKTAKRTGLIFTFFLKNANYLWDNFPMHAIPAEVSRPLHVNTT